MSSLLGIQIVFILIQQGQSQGEFTHTEPNILVNNSIGLSEPVVFERVDVVHLSRSTFQVHSVIDFLPFQEELAHLREYIKEEQRKANILVDFDHPIYNHDSRKKKTPRENLRKDYFHQMFILAKEQLGTLDELLNVTETKFLEAIDHLIDHPGVETIPSNMLELMDGHFDPDTPFIRGTTLAGRTRQLNLTETEIKERHKRFVGFLGGMLGGYIANRMANKRTEKTLNLLKNNVHALRENDNILEKKISANYAFIDITRMKVRIQGKLLKEHGVQMEELARVDRVQYAETGVDLAILSYALSQQIRQMHVSSGITGIQMDTQRVGDYLTSLANSQITPILVPPPDLRAILKDVNNVLKTYNRLELPIDPEKDIWSYYKLTTVTPVVLQDCLIVTMHFPLIDRSVELSIYRAYSIPLMNKEMDYAFEYELESKYIAFTKDMVYTTLPSEEDVNACLLTGGKVCIFNSALYLSSIPNWCILALFQKDSEKIRKYCTVKARSHMGNFAYHLGNNLWLLSATEEYMLTIRCQEDHHKFIRPPYALLSLPNSCEAESNSLKIPAEIDISVGSTVPNSKRTFMGFSNINLPGEEGLFDRLGWTDANSSTLAEIEEKLDESRDRIRVWSDQLDEFENPEKGGKYDTTKYEDILKLKLKDINEDYPVPVSFTKLLIVALGLVFLVLCIVAIGLYCYVKQSKKVKSKIKSQVAQLLGPSAADFLQEVEDRIMPVSTENDEPKPPISEAEPESGYFSLPTTKRIPVDTEWEEVVLENSPVHKSKTVLDLRDPRSPKFDRNRPKAVTISIDPEKYQIPKKSESMVKMVSRRKTLSSPKTVRIETVIPEEEEADITPSLNAELMEMTSFGTSSPRTLRKLKARQTRDSSPTVVRSILKTPTPEEYLV